MTFQILLLELCWPIVLIACLLYRPLLDRLIDWCVKDIGADWS